MRGVLVRSQTGWLGWGGHTQRDRQSRKTKAGAGKNIIFGFFFFLIKHSYFKHFFFKLSSDLFSSVRYCKIICKKPMC